MLRILVGPARFELATSTMSRLAELATTRQDTSQTSIKYLSGPGFLLAFPTRTLSWTYLNRESFLNPPVIFFSVIRLFSERNRWSIYQRLAEFKIKPWRVD